MIEKSFARVQKQSSGGVLRYSTNFGKFRGKRLCQSQIFSNATGLDLATLLIKGAPI